MIERENMTRKQVEKAISQFVKNGGIIQTLPPQITPKKWSAKGKELIELIGDAQENIYSYNLNELN